MKTRHGMGVGLVGLLISTAAFAAAPVASKVTEEAAVAASSPSDPVMEEIVVTARHPDADAEPRNVEIVEIAMQDPLDLLSAAPIHAPDLTDPIVLRPEIRRNL